MTNQNNTLSFRVSAGLKNLIGRDLISDKYIAVFELVKNSYDAGASSVIISYNQTTEGKEQIIKICFFRYYHRKFYNFLHA